MGVSVDAAYLLLKLDGFFFGRFFSLETALIFSKDSSFYYWLVIRLFGVVAISVEPVAVLLLSAEAMVVESAFEVLVSWAAVPVA